MRILGSERPRAHLFWGSLCLAILVAWVAYVAWYKWHGLSVPGGSSPIPFVVGLVLAAVVFFEFALWPRKLLRRYRRLGQAQLWMRAHIWLGLACLPLTFWHGGESWNYGVAFGGSLSTWLTWLMIAVIASGIYGLLLQQYIPRLLLDSVPEEIILSQATRRLDQNHRLAIELVSRACPPANGAETDPAMTVPLRRVRRDHLIVGAVRSPQTLEVDLIQKYSPSTGLREPDNLRQAFRQVVRPYLDPQLRPRRGGQLSSGPRALAFFAELRKRVEPEAEPIVDLLEGWCRQRRQIDRQRSLTMWLHGWMPVHLCLSASLVVLMIVHAVIAVKYW